MPSLPGFLVSSFDTTFRLNASKKKDSKKSLTKLP